MPMVFRVKIRVKVQDEPAASQENRDAVKGLIEKHGGKDGSRARPGKFMDGVFSSKEAAKAFRTEARTTVRAGG